MHCLVTGGAGFVGSHLCERLLAQGDAVTVLDNLSTGSFRNVEHLAQNKRFRCVVDTITREDTVAEVVRDCDQVYHLAAAVGVELVLDRPVETIMTNIRGTEVVLEQACRYRRRTLLVSTSEVYGKSDQDAFAETDDRIMGPTNLCRWAYAETKAMDEFLGLAYHTEKQFPVVIARLFNTVGPRQTGRYGMVVPRFVEQALANRPITVYGTGEQTRCFCHVADVVPALIELMNRNDCVGEVYNVGSDQEITIAELARRVIRLTRSKSQIAMVSYENAYARGFDEMLHRKPNLDKLRRTLGRWAPRGLDCVLRDVIAEKRSEVEKRKPRTRNRLTRAGT
jgi:UDP-glucose 4-epimerase